MTKELLISRIEEEIARLESIEYDNSIVSLASSIRRYFELDVYHNTLSDIDKILEEYKPKNVVVILFDGMGSILIKKY